MQEQTVNLQTMERHTWFQHLLYGSKLDKVTSLVNSEGYDSSNLLVELKVNGVSMRVEDFDDLLDKWSDRIEAQVKEKHGISSFEAEVLKKANELIKNKLYNIQEVLDNVENQLYKLELED